MGAVVTTVWSGALLLGMLVPLIAVKAGRFAAGTSAFVSSGAYPPPAPLFATFSAIYPSWRTDETQAEDQTPADFGPYRQ